MAVSVPSLAPQRASFGETWLYNRDWDLRFISLSVVLVPIPYLVYLLLMNAEPLMGPLAASFGTTVDDLSRNAINFMVAILIGGPHMYATFSRTALDHDFKAKHQRLLLSSLGIPVLVISLAMLNLPLLLTVFFFWASIHVLHQMVFITELYNKRQNQKSSLTLFSRIADYGVIMTALYPIGVWKMTQGNFIIGQHNVGAEVANLMAVFGLSMGPWMVWMAGGAFVVFLGMWIVATVQAYQAGTIHWPKTVFVFLTVVASFFVPALGNLDTAFQGMNFWHSTQYLALTWMLNNLRQERGELQNSPFVERMSKDKTLRKFYWFNFSLMSVNLGLGFLIFGILYVLAGQGFDYSFDRAYYVAVLSILWMHYYQDHFLFTDPHVLTGAASRA
ncbi:MAG: hypothetical protein ACLFTK_03955 [Anaerolineales bacterium]